MAKFYPTSDIDIGISRMAIVEGVTGSFGSQCTLVQIEAMPSCFALFIEGECPQLLIAHDNLEYSDDGWKQVDIEYAIDAQALKGTKAVSRAFESHGAKDISFNVIHVVDCVYDDQLKSHSSWSIVAADPLMIAESVEGEARPDMNAVSAEIIELIAAELSNTEVLQDNPVDPSEMDGNGSISSTDEIIISTNSGRVSLEKIKKTPNVFDDRMVEVLQEIMGRLNLVSASCDDRTYEINTILSADGIFPAILVSAAQVWAVLLHSRPNIPGFFVRLKTDPNAMLGYRVEAIHSNHSGSVPIAIFQSIQPKIDDVGNCDLMEIIDSFHASLESYHSSRVGDVGDVAV